MYLYRGSNHCPATGSIQNLAAAERYPAREGACGRLGDKCDRLDDSFGMNTPRPWQQVADRILRSYSLCSCFLLLSIQRKIPWMQLD